jgi:hypothetical protein
MVCDRRMAIFVYWLIVWLGSVMGRYHSDGYRELVETRMAWVFGRAGTLVYFSELQ